MSIRLGTTNPSAFRLGNTAVSKLMLGNTEVWSSVPPFGRSSRSFNGSSQYIEDGSFVSRNNLSVAMWIKTPENYVNSALFGVGQYFNAASSFAFANRVPVAGTVRFEFSVSNTDYRIWSAPATTGWRHVAVIYGGGTLALYINGVIQSPGGGGGAFTRSIPSSSNNYRIGRDSGARYFTGNMADVREYNRVLSGSDVALLASGIHVPLGLVGWWMTDADDVSDYSGSGKNGTNYGSAYSSDGPLD